MKKIVYVINMLVLALLLGCTNENNLVDLSGLENPKNVSALTTVTQDNTGLVTFIPRGEGVTRYEIYFGDGTIAPAYVAPGARVDHKYKEGVYDAKIVGTTLNGGKTETIQKVVVSFKAPQNLVVTIENDAQVSKKVTVTAKADFALFYDVYFGEAGKPNPISGNNGESVSYTYNLPGVYKIRVVSKSAAIQTTEFSKDFTVTEVNKPFASAPTPPNRQAGDVISIYSAKYTNLAGTDFFPYWGQSQAGYAATEFDLNGDKILNYINLSYQGTQFANSVDVSGMEFLHMDVWTADVQKFTTFLISKTSGEKPVVKDLVAGQWTSIEIPITAFTSQGLTVKDIFQFKYEGTPSGKGSVFIDNIYFYKTPSQLNVMPIDFESTSLKYTWVGFGASDFGPIPSSVVANPDKTGVNVSNTVLKIEKTAGAQVWAGAAMELDAVVDLAKGKIIKVAVWSPKAGSKILFKMEDTTSPKDGNGNPTIFVEVEATATVANAWQILSFDLTTSNMFSAANKYNKVALFPNFGTAGAAGIYYFDDIKQSN
jgi:hypothetical protein